MIYDISIILKFLFVICDLAHSWFRFPSARGERNGIKTIISCFSSALADTEMKKKIQKTEDRDRLKITLSKCIRVYRMKKWSRFVQDQTVRSTEAPFFFRRRPPPTPCGGLLNGLRKTNCATVRMCGHLHVLFAECHP